MDRTKLRRLKYKIENDLLTLQNMAVVVLAVVCVGFIWASIAAMHRNYDLQRRVDDRRREALILELETATLEYERNYYKTKEYQELAAREKLGLANEGEQLLVMPPNSESATNKYAEGETASTPEKAVEDQSNAYQWLKFLMGANSQS